MYRKKSLVIIAMIIAVITMAIGYAAFQTQLKINGTGSITSTWNISITNLTSAATGAAYNVSTPSYTATTASFNVGLKKPGDKMTFTVTIKNGGTVDAIIDTIDTKATGSNVIIYTISGIQAKSRLAGGASKSFTIVVEFDSNATSIPLRTEKELTVNINCIQDDGQSLTPTTPSIDNKLTPGEEILFNPKTYAICSSEGVDACYKWYVINDNGTNVDLILNQNISIGTQTNGTSWDESGNQYNGPSTIFTHLNLLGQTGQKWSSLLTRHDTYTNTSSKYPPANYTVDYSGFVARIPTYEELNPLKEGEYLPKWLTANLKAHEGYWLASSKIVSALFNADAVFALAPGSYGTFNGYPVKDPGEIIGIRPVITIPSSKL